MPAPGAAGAAIQVMVEFVRRHAFAGAGRTAHGGMPGAIVVPGWVGETTPKISGPEDQVRQSERWYFILFNIRPVNGAHTGVIILHRGHVRIDIHAIERSQHCPGFLHEGHIRHREGGSDIALEGINRRLRQQVGSIGRAHVFLDEPVHRFSLGGEVNQRFCGGNVVSVKVAGHGLEVHIPHTRPGGRQQEIGRIAQVGAVDSQRRITELRQRRARKVRPAFPAVQVIDDRLWGAGEQRIHRDPPGGVLAVDQPDAVIHILHHLGEL